MQISKICKTCTHFAYTWDNQPMCCLGHNFYEYDGSICGEYQRRPKLYD